MHKGHRNEGARLAPREGVSLKNTMPHPRCAGLAVMVGLCLGCSAGGPDLGETRKNLPTPSLSVAQNSPPAVPAENKTDATLIDDRYVDPKGNFKINPPKNWKPTDYPEDPRGKVAFVGPKAQVDLRVLVSDWGTTDFERFYQETKANATDVQRQIGSEVSLVRERFIGREALRRSFTYRGLRSTAIMFLDGSRKHDIQYTAPETLYEDYANAVVFAMSTYEPLVSNNASGPAEHQLANAVRLAKLFSEANRPELALEYVERGLRINPEHTKLLDLKQRLSK